MKKIIIIESPYAGDPRTVTHNIKYAQLALRDSLERGEAPYASHLLYTQVLDDRDPSQRKLGLDTARSFMAYADAIAVYDDLGVTDGMMRSIEHAHRIGLPVVWRSLQEKI